MQYLFNSQNAWFKQTLALLLVVHVDFGTLETSWSGRRLARIHAIVPCRESVLLRSVRIRLGQQRPLGLPHENSHRGEALSLQLLRQGVRAEGQPEKAHGHGSRIVCLSFSRESDISLPTSGQDNCILFFFLFFIRLFLSLGECTACTYRDSQSAKKVYGRHVIINRLRSNRPPMRRGFYFWLTLPRQVTLVSSKISLLC